MATHTDQDAGHLDAATGLDISYLWHLMGEDLLLGFGGAPEFEGRLTAHSSLALSHLPSADVNMVIIAGASDAETRLREYHQIIVSTGLPAVVVLGGTVAGSLAPVAEALGLTDAGNAPLMVYQPQHTLVPSEDYTVERVVDAAGFEAALDMFSRAFCQPPDLSRRAFPPTMLDLPGMAYFLARRGAEPRSSVATIRHGTFVGIYSMATPLEYQRQGAGRALLDYAVADHVSREATTFYLVATEQGYPLYERIGFTTVDMPAIWLAGPSAQFS